MPWYAYLFWLWFAAAIGIYIYRAVRWGTRKATGQPTEREKRKAAKFDRILSTPSDLSPTQQLFKDAATARATGMSEMAPAGPASGGATTAEPAAPLTDLLRGIELPCELAPLIDSDATDLDRRVAFWTRGFSEGDISSQLGAALEKLGFAVITVGGTELTATRDGQRISVRIHPDAHQARRDDRPAFPTVAAGSSVVEIFAG